MTDGGTDFKPTSIVSDKEEEVDGLNISNAHYSQEESERLEVNARAEDTQYRWSDKEGDQYLYDQESAHQEGIKHSSESVHAFQRETAERGNIASAKEGYIDKEQEDEHSTTIASFEKTVGSGASVLVQCAFHFKPEEHGAAEADIKQEFVRDTKQGHERSKSKADGEQSCQIIVVRLSTVNKWEDARDSYKEWFACECRHETPHLSDTYI